MSFVIGQEVYFLSEYELWKGTVLSVGKKNLKIAVPARGFSIAHDIRKPFEKCAHPTEKVAVVWEMWRGQNGRGRYRLEKVLYPHRLVEACLYPHQFQVHEKLLGQEN